MPAREAGADAAVTDTHALVFHAAGGARLGAKAAAFYARCERQQAILYVPMAVVWECSLLARASRINLRRTVREFFADLFSNPAYQPLDLTAEQVFLADELRFNRDPFDALICAAAQDMGLPLVTRDPDIRGSGAVKVIW
jgi:PIN domain nuclease of toxin-antitoxin system